MWDDQNSASAPMPVDKSKPKLPGDKLTLRVRHYPCAGGDVVCENRGDDQEQDGGECDPWSVADRVSDCEPAPKQRHRDALDAS